MKRKLTYFLGSFAIALTAVFAFASAPAGAAVAGSCQTQCRVAYDKCVKQANNPGGLNQCKRAFDSCLATCR